MDSNLKSADFGAADKAVEIQQSIHRLLQKLEQQDQLQWPEMLDSYMVISAQFSSLMKILRPSQTDANDSIQARNVTLMPVKLSPDLDPVLQRITEGRIPVWSHSVVPDYLRTKADRDGEMYEKQLLEKAPKTSTIEQLNKSSTDMNKRIDSIISMLTNDFSRTEDEGRLRAKQSYSTDDTRTLIRMITSGKGLEIQQQQAASTAKTPEVLRAQQQIGASLDGMNQGSPSPGKYVGGTARPQIRPGPYSRPM